MTGSFGLDISHRRDLQGLIAALADLKNSMHVAATFKSVDYGVYMIEGTAVLSVSGSFLAGGQPLDSGPRTDTSRKPVQSLRALSLGIRVRDAGGPAVLDNPVTNDSLVHGDLVQATFEQSPYGQFDVTGVAIWAPAGNVFTIGGGWFLTTPAGEQASRLTKLARLAAPGAHKLSVPAPFEVWPSSDDGDSN